VPPGNRALAVRLPVWAGLATALAGFSIEFDALPAADTYPRSATDLTRDLARDRTPDLAAQPASHTEGQKF
jgi:hypothetical protein